MKRVLPNVVLASVFQGLPLGDAKSNLHDAETCFRVPSSYNFPTLRHARRALVWGFARSISFPTAVTFGELSFHVDQTSSSCFFFALSSFRVGGCAFLKARLLWRSKLKGRGGLCDPELPHPSGSPVSKLMNESWKKTETRSE